MTAASPPPVRAHAPQGRAVDFTALPAVREQKDADVGSLRGHPCLTGDEPVILRGLVRHWPEVGLGNEALLDQIAAQASDRPLPFYTAGPEARGRVFYDATLGGFNFERRTGRLAECCQWLRESAQEPEAGTLYVGSTAVDGWWPAFSGAHPLDPGGDPVLCSLWLGNATRIAAHYDFPRNLACVVAGRRRFTLFPPQQAMNLYPGPLELTPSGQPISLVDFHAVDEDRFPRFSEALAQAQVAELEPGDALYIPPMWWHHVEAHAAVNLLINYWWRDSALYLGSPQAALLHAALAIGQLSVEERAPWEALFRACVFERDEALWRHIPEPARGVLGEMDGKQAEQLRQQIVRQLGA